jgi:hypothetical protein
MRLKNRTNGERVGVASPTLLRTSGGMKAARKTSFLPFEEARSVARGLGFGLQAEYYAAARKGALPQGLPKAPDSAYRLSGWRSWGDWLGSGRQSWLEKNQKRRPFPEVLDFVRSLGLQGRTDWRRWVRSGQCPDDIPTTPERSFRAEGWQGWAHFLGTTDKKSGDTVWRKFADAREWVRSQGLKSQREWKAFVRAGRLPSDIPTNPWLVYRDDWTTIGDWLGGAAAKGERHSKNKQWRSFPEARDYARSLGLRSRAEWSAHCKSGKLPADIPADPAHVYLDSGWISVGDWLGTNTVAPRYARQQFRNFEEAREFVRSQHFQMKTEFEAWARSSERPPDIPALPSRTYAKTGWQGWGDWLGVHNRWSKTSLLAFVSSLVPLLNRFQPSEIYAILRQNGCLIAADSLADSSPLKHLVQAVLHQDTEAVQNSLRDLRSEKLDDTEIVPSAEGPKSDAITETIALLPENEVRLPDLGPIDILSGLDDLERSVIVSDAETVEFLITNAVGRLWSRVLRSENVERDLAELRSHNSGSYSSRVRERFLAQFNGAHGLVIPEGYCFRKKGEAVLPNLMQRLIAHRVAVDRRVGNWSGTGAGKTLGAILASRALGAKLTVIVALNNAMLDLYSGWPAEILNAFPESHVVIKERGTLSLDETKPTYLLLNYETFQQRDSQAFVKTLIQNHKIDFMILDEVHIAKSRGKVESKRRQLINYLLSEAAKANSDLRVLAMSATPVINSLDEAVSLLEMVTGHGYPDLDVRPKVSSALAIHEQLVINGVRYVPRGTRWNYTSGP